MPPDSPSSDAREPALPRVVPRAKHECLEDLLLLGLRSRAAACGARRGACRRRGTLRGTRPPRASTRPSRADEEAPPVEHEVVVATHLVDVDHRQGVPLGQAGDHALPEFELPRGEGRRGHVDDEVGPVFTRLLHRVAMVAGSLPEVLVVPDVLADADRAVAASPPRGCRRQGPVRSSGLRRTRRRSAGAPCGRSVRPGRRAGASRR